MGLDIVEIVIAVEERFGVAIPDVEAGALQTPRAMAEFVIARLPKSNVAHTPAEVHHGVKAIVTATLGLRDDEYDENADFVHDLGAA